MENQYCKGCAYYVLLSPTNSDGGMRVCDYIGFTGKARSKICPAGEGCTVKAKTPEMPSAERYDQGGYPVRRRRRGPKSRIDAGAVRRMAGQGMSDPRIARALGCSVNTVFKVRKENGIPPGVKV